MPGGASKSSGPSLVRSHLLQVQQVRIFMRHLHGRAALAAAALSGDQGPLLRAAGRDAQVLWREKVPWARALSQLLQAGTAAGGGSKEKVPELLREAAARCDAADMHLFAVAARRCLGQWLGHEEGRTLRACAEEWMAGQQVVRPDRMEALLAPLGLRLPERLTLTIS